MLAVPLILVAAMGEMMVIVARHVDLSIGSILGFSRDRRRHDLPRSSRICRSSSGVVAAIALGAALGLSQRPHRHPLQPALDHRDARHAQPLPRARLSRLGLRAKSIRNSSRRSLIGMSQTSPIFGIPWIVRHRLSAGLRHLSLPQPHAGRAANLRASAPTRSPRRCAASGSCRSRCWSSPFRARSPGVAGIMYASRFGYVNPGITGVGFEFTVIAAVVVGGVSINGGVGTVLGTVLGVLLLGMVDRRAADPRGLGVLADRRSTARSSCSRSSSTAPCASAASRSASRGAAHDRHRARPARARRRTRAAALASPSGPPGDRHAAPAVGAIVVASNLVAVLLGHRASSLKASTYYTEFAHRRARADHGHHLGRDRPFARRDDGALGLRLRLACSRPGLPIGLAIPAGL